MADRATIAPSPVLIWGQSTTRRIPLTPALGTELRLYRALSGIGPYRLLALASSPAPAGLDHHTIYGWMRRGCKSARADHFAYVLDSWRRRAWGGPGQAAPDRIAITAALRARLRSHLRRIGPGAIKALSAVEPLPEGLSAGIIASWLSGTTRTALRPHLDCVLDRWARVPARRAAPDRLPITPDLRSRLQAEAERIGPGAFKLLSAAGPLPEGLNAGMVKAWLSGATRSALRPHLDFIMDRWATIPDRGMHTESTGRPVPVQKAAPVEREEVTAAIRRELQHHRERTDLGPGAFLSFVDGRPPGLGHAAIAGWLSGVTKTARADHLAFVRRAWAESPARIGITEDMRQALVAERTRTGVTPQVLLRAMKDPPPHLNAAIIAGWLSGTAATAFEHHLDHVLEAWRALPDAPQRA